MACTRQDIENWLNNAKTKNADFMIVVCDTFDHDDYPVYCSKEDFAAKYNDHNGVNMQKIMEVYDVSMDFKTQLNEHRAFNFPVGFKK